MLISFGPASQGLRIGHKEKDASAVLQHFMAILQNIATTRMDAPRYTILKTYMPDENESMRREFFSGNADSANLGTFCKKLSGGSSARGQRKHQLPFSLRPASGVLSRIPAALSFPVYPDDFGNLTFARLFLNSNRATNAATPASGHSIRQIWMLNAYFTFPQRDPSHLAVSLPSVSILWPLLVPVMCIVPLICS